MDYAEYGIDWLGPISNEIEENTEIEVPEVRLIPEPFIANQLSATIDPLRPSECQGVDIYLDTLNFLYTHFHTQNRLAIELDQA